MSPHIFDPSRVKDGTLVLWARHITDPKEIEAGDLFSIWGVYRKDEISMEPSPGKNMARVWVRAKAGVDTWLCDAGISKPEANDLISEKVAKGHQPLSNTNPHGLAYAWDAWRFLSSNATKDIAFRQTRDHRLLIEEFWNSMASDVPACAPNIASFLVKMQRLLDPMALKIPKRNPIGSESSWAW